MSFENQFDISLVNEDLETTLLKARQLVDDFLKK
jgi:hypothetical protein